eukprot:14463-Chlamydomonas_euryale.AAC.1
MTTTWVPEAVARARMFDSASMTHAVLPVPGMPQMYCRCGDEASVEKKCGEEVHGGRKDG